MIFVGVWCKCKWKIQPLVALNYLREFWFERKEDMDQPTDAIPFLLDTETPKLPSEFEIKFYVGSTKYWYLLSIDKKRYYWKNSIIIKVYNPLCYFPVNGNKDNLLSNLIHL